MLSVTAVLVATGRYSFSDWLPFRVPTDALPSGAFARVEFRFNEVSKHSDRPAPV
jgi:hypothetical protein